MPRTVKLAKNEIPQKLSHYNLKIWNPKNERGIIDLSRSYLPSELHMAGSLVCSVRLVAYLIFRYMGKGES